MPKSLNELQIEIHKCAVEHGWWDSPRALGDIMTNIQSELSEAWEEYRRGVPVDQVYYGEDGKPEGFPIEMADAVIRILDTCQFYGIDLAQCIELKMAYNAKRPYRHGNKLA